MLIVSISRLGTSIGSTTTAEAAADTNRKDTDRAQIARVCASQMRTLVTSTEWQYCP
jgi:hypothetical protein